jgi:nucleotide-binding universal stress UspA family protein
VVLKTVLIALDDSEASAQLIQMVQHLKLDSDAQLILAHVIYEEPIDIVSDRPPAELADLDALYAERLSDYKNALPWEITIEVVWGDPAEEIIRLAHIHTANLIVMGTRGLTGVNRVLQGSVSSQVVADSPCSVLVVKPNESV